MHVLSTGNFILKYNKNKLYAHVEIKVIFVVFTFLINFRYVSLHHFVLIRIGDVIVSMLDLSVVDRGFKSNQRL